MPTSENLRDFVQAEIKKAIGENISQLIREQLRPINAVLDGFRSSLTLIEAQLESLKVTIIEKNNTIISLKQENTSLRDNVQKLHEHIHQYEQQLLANDVDIVGVPEVKGESVAHIVITLARKIGVTITEVDIVSADRVGSNREDPTGRVRVRPIAVRLARRVLREELLRAARVRRGVTTADAGLTGGDSRRFYINERLTRENRQLFLQVREVGARLKWRFVWTKDGRVYARQNQSEESPRHRIRSEVDLVRVFGPAAVGS